MKILITFTMLLFTTLASAGILIEPQLGYVLSSKYSGTFNLSGPATGTATLDYKSTGLEYGGRLGYQFLGVMGGLNYGKTSSKSKDTTGSYDYKGTNVGVFIGYSAPILVRAWYAYNFSSKAEVSSATPASFKGSSSELGLGFTGIPFLSVNLIYRMYSFTTYATSTLSYTASGFNPKELELAFSAPFNLF
jgi:hypothetical protein